MSGRTRARIESATSLVTSSFWSSDAAVMMSFAVIVGIGAALGTIIFVQLIAFFYDFFLCAGRRYFGFSVGRLSLSCRCLAACWWDRWSTLSRRRQKVTACPKSYREFCQGQRAGDTYVRVRRVDDTIWGRIKSGWLLTRQTAKNLISHVSQWA